MNNIFFNSFYDTEALPKWNFEVSFIFYNNAGALAYDSAEESYTKNAVYSELLSQAVTNIKLPEMKVENLVTYLPGFHFAYPAKPGLNGELQITFNDDMRLTIRKIADYLMQYHYNPRYQQQPYFDTGTDTYLSIAHMVCGDMVKNFVIPPKFDIYVRIYDQSNEFVQKIVYKNCFVKSIAGIDLDYSSEELVNTQITVSYPYFKVLDEDTEANTDYNNESNGMTTELENSVEGDKVPSENTDTADTSTNETEGPKETETTEKKTLEQPEEDKATTTTETPVNENNGEDESSQSTKTSSTDATQENQETDQNAKGDAGSNVTDDVAGNPTAEATAKALEEEQPDNDYQGR